ncbi:MAG: hypothetical protein ABI741_07835 [Ferruginibacter sp.]
MKRLTFIFLLLLICIFPAKAQDAAIKTIPGVFTTDHWDSDWKVMQVTPDGHAVLFQVGSKCYILLPKEGRLNMVEQYWPMNGEHECRISPDHSLSYQNSPNICDGRGLYGSMSPTLAPNAKNYVAVLSRLTDIKPLKVFSDTNFIVGINKQNQLIVSSAWTREHRLTGLKGLRLLDPKTFNTLKVLRTDTLYNNTAQDPINQPVFLFNSTYTALISTYFVSGDYIGINIFPFGSDSIIRGGTIRQQTWHYPTADEHYIYAADKDSLLVYSMHTAKLLYKTVYATATSKPAYNYRRCLYTLAGNGHLYRYDREQSAVYEEEVTPDALRTVKTYPLHFDNTLPFPTGNQRYQMAACAGPSLLIIPRNRVDDNVPENAAFVIDLPSGKMTLRIAPFFNINAAQLEREAKYFANEAAYNAKSEADMKAAKKAEADAALQARYADCERILAEAKMKIGTYYPMGALVYKNEPGHSCRIGYAIWGFDCDTKHFTAAGLGTYDADADKSSYRLCELGPYGICPECNGHPLSSSSEYIKDDSWHQTNFNVYKRDPNALKKVNVTTTCKYCKGKGVVRL